MLFRPPIGNGKVPPIGWRISNPFGAYYLLKRGATPDQDVHAYHTGIDALLQEGGSKGQNIYAIADGLVTFARRVVNSTWGNLLVLQHTDDGGQHFYSRYGHDNDFTVAEGDRVCIGQIIAHVGDAFGQFIPHLHFDISLTETLLIHPADWPGLDLERLRQTYVDPIAFLKGQQMATPNEQIAGLAQQIITLTQVEPPAPPPEPNATVTANGLRVRSAPNTSGTIVATLNTGARVTVTDSGTAGWSKLIAPYAGSYVSSQYLSFS